MDSYFKRFFPNDINALDGYHREIQHHLTETTTMLDLGCGDNTQLARYRGPRRQVWGADFHQHPQLQNADWFRLLPSNGQLPFQADSFDLITACWVMEHVADPVFFLKEIQRVLRPGGAFIGITVNGAHYVTWLIRLFHQLPHLLTQRIVKRLYGRPHHDTFPTHYRMNTVGPLQRVAGKTGLEMTGISTFANPDYFSFSKSLRRIAIVADWFLEEWFPGWGRLYVVPVLRKRSTEQSSINKAA